MRALCVTPVLALFTISSMLPAQIPSRVRVNDAAINAAIGGVVGAAWAAVRGSSLPKGFAQGLTGGLIVSGGRQTAARTFEGAGFVGREISAVGTSLVSSVGKPAVTFFFPIGPFSVQFASGSFDWRVHLADCAIATATALSPHSRIDWGLSLSAGAPVFRTHGSGVTGAGNTDASGTTYGAVVWLAPDAFFSDRRTRQVLGHESVHVTQEDFVQNALTLPIESAILGQSPSGRSFLRHFDLGVLGDASALIAAHFIPYGSQPWEKEAYALEAR